MLSLLLVCAIVAAVITAGIVGFVAGVKNANSSKTKAVEELVNKTLKK